MNNVLICEGVFLGTNDGPMGNIPATGKKMDLRFSLIAIIDSDGLISEERSYYDNAGFLSQLGL